MERAQLRATKAQIRRIKNSFFWKDLIRELKSWAEGIDSEMYGIVDDSRSEVIENDAGEIVGYKTVSTAEVLLHMGDCNGRKKTMQYVEQIPDIFISILGGDNEEEEDGS